MADRLISADALKAALQGLYQVAGWEKRDIHFSLSDMECNIDYMPTIEAEPIKHGRWIYDDEAYPGGNPYGHYNCDQCGESVPHKTIYCPNCGADMRGEQDE